VFFFFFFFKKNSFYLSFSYPQQVLFTVKIPVQANNIKARY